MRILIVEDDELIASFLEKGLKQAGFAVDSVTCAEDGLGMILSTFYDVAIIDLMLPQMDGLTLIENIRRKNNHTPVLILSAKRSVDDRITGLQKGGDDYITKPFSFSELLARMQALIRRAGMKPFATTELEVADLTMNLMTRKVI